MRATTVYKCPACNEEYSTKAKAEACYKSVGDTGIKVGDLVMKNGKCWKVFHVAPDLVTLDRVNEYMRLVGWDIHGNYQEKCQSSRNQNCGGKKFKLLTIEDVEKHLQRRRMQVKCGETLLGELKCRSGESFTLPGLKEPSVSLKQPVLRSGQKPATKRATKPGTKSTRRTKSR